MTKIQPKFLSMPSGRRLAYRQFIASGGGGGGGGCGVMWLGGFASDMDGTKASFLAEWAEKNHVDFLRFDYSGCGLSGGDFYDGNISRWREDAFYIFDQLARDKQLIIASSMGAWIGLHLAMDAVRAKKIAAMMLIAPAPDFTHKLLSQKFREKIIHADRLPADHPSGPLSRGLIEDAQGQLIMDKPIELSCPVHILHGLADDVVPLSHALDLVNIISAPQMVLTIIKGADHRLSEPVHLQQMEEIVARLYARAFSHS